MLAQNPSQILKAEFRGLIKSQNNQCLATFNYLDFQEKSREAFGNLIVFNDEILAPNQALEYKTSPNQTVFLLPLVGAIDVKSAVFNEFVTINQLYSFFVENQEIVTISNPYETEIVHFLQIKFQTKNLNYNKISFNLDANNKIITLIDTQEFSVSIAFFNARNQGFYKLKQNGIFAFVINGAFEFENRLLENRDGLKIWDIEEVEFEALSENAILLIIDVII